MEKRDLSFKNFISIFFKNLTFDKISEDDFNNNETDYYKNSETDSFKGGKYNFNNDILKLKLEIPNTVTTQFDDLESKLNDIVKKSDKLIPKIQKQLNKRNNDYLIYGGVNETNDNLSFLPQQNNNNEIDLQMNNDSITQQHLDSDLIKSNSNSFNDYIDFVDIQLDDKDYKENIKITEDSEDKQDIIDNDANYDEIITHDDIEKQLTDLYEPLKGQIENDSNNNLELKKKIVLLSNDLNPNENLLKSEQKETTEEDKVLIGGIEKVDLVTDNIFDYNEYDNIIYNDDVLESLSDIKKIDADINDDEIDVNINDSESSDTIIGGGEIDANIDDNDYDNNIGNDDYGDNNINDDDDEIDANINDNDYDNNNFDDDEIDANINDNDYDNTNDDDFDAFVGGSEIIDANNNDNNFDAIVGGGEIEANIDTNIYDNQIDANINDGEYENESLKQLTSSIDPEYVKGIITNVIEDQQNENKKIRLGF